MKKETIITAILFFGFGFLAGYIYDAQKNWRAQQRAQAGGSMPGRGQTPGSEAMTGSLAGVPAGLPEGHPPIDPAALIKVLEDQAAQNPKDSEPRLRLANFLYDQRQFQQAAEWYQKALAVDPANVNARTDLGTCYFALGRPEDALKEYEKSLRTDSRHEPTLFNLVVVNLEGTRNLAAARAAWERLRQQNPDYPGLERLKQSLDAAGAATDSSAPK